MGYLKFKEQHTWNPPPPLGNANSWPLMLIVLYLHFLEINYSFIARTQMSAFFKGFHHFLAHFFFFSSWGGGGGDGFQFLGNLWYFQQVPIKMHNLFPSSSQMCSHMFPICLPIGPCHVTCWVLCLSYMVLSYMELGPFFIEHVS